MARMASERPTKGPKEPELEIGTCSRVTRSSNQVWPHLKRVSIVTYTKPLSVMSTG